MSIESMVLKAFLKDVVAYTAFLESWFSSERWRSTQPGVPLHCGAITSAEIAYVLLRFGRFYTSDWEEWKNGGFVAMDTSINETIFEIKGMLKAERAASSAALEAESSPGCADSLKGLISVLYGERRMETSPYMQYPLLYALAVHIFVNLDRPGTDIVSLCRRLNLIVMCSP